MSEPLKVLLLGGHGMLGKAWRELLAKRSARVHAPRRSELDISNFKEASMPLEIDLIVNCAAWTDVDGAEEKYKEACQTNWHAVRQLAEVAHQFRIPFVHYSTDYVFNGEGSSPYPVDAPTDPVNRYGASKLHGETAIKQVYEGANDSHPGYLLIRTSWLYASWGKNFVKTIMHLLLNKNEIKVVNDQIGLPTSCKHLAEASLKLFESGNKGTFHLTDGGEACSWFDFACQIKKSMITHGTEIKCQIDPCDTQSFPRPAKRPAYSVMDISAADRIAGPFNTWQSRVDDCVKTLLEENQA